MVVVVAVDGCCRLSRRPTNEEGSAVFRSPPRRRRFDVVVGPLQRRTSGVSLRRGVWEGKAGCDDNDDDKDEKKTTKTKKTATYKKQ